MRYPPLQAPLFWQTCLCFWIGGIAAAVWPHQTLLCFFLLFLADKRLWQAAPLAFCALLALAGLLTAQWQLYGSPWRHGFSEPERPPWLMQAGKKVRVCGTVTDSQGLPDQRLRLLLADLAPEGDSHLEQVRNGNTAAPTPAQAADPAPSAAPDQLADPAPSPGTGAQLSGQAVPSPGTGTSLPAKTVPAFTQTVPESGQSMPLPAQNTPLSGQTALTWEHPPWHPLPGQILCLSLRPMPMQGFANKGQAAWELWWASQGVYWRMWTQDRRAEPRLHGEPGRSGRWREALREDFLAALVAPRSLPPADKGASPAPPTSHAHSDATPKSSAHSPLPGAADMPQGKAILLALLFGDRQYLDQATLNNFIAATLVHSLALSGQHLVIAGMLGLACVLTLARIRPGIYLHRPRTLWVILASLPPALAYLWLGNAPASLLRATVMLFVVALWLTMGRPRTTLDALCAALLCITVAAPLNVFDTGLQLSALCVGAIGLSLPWLRELMPGFNGAPTSGARARLAQWSRALLRIFLVSLCIQVVLLPLNMLLFGNAGFWFPLNVAWLPVADLFVLPASVLGLACAALGMETAARLVLDVAALPCQWLVDLLAWLAANDLLLAPSMLRPHWTALPAFAALLTALAFKAGRPTLPPAAQRLLLAGGLLLLVGPMLRLTERLSPEIRLDVLDVGQSQAVALRLPGHMRLLLDGGGSVSPRFDPGQNIVAPVLLYNDRPHLAAVLNSHPDLDHMGGLVHILRQFTVSAFFDNGRDSGDARGGWAAIWAQTRRQYGAQPLAQGDVLQLGDPAHGLQLEILHPPRTDRNTPGAGTAARETWDGNNASLVARLTLYGQGLALIPGDAERRSLRHMLDQGLDLRAQVLVLPHHGSDSSYLPDLYEAVQPEVAVAACGFENRYGYPGKKVREWLDGAGIPLLFTGRDGQISLRWTSASGRAKRKNEAAHTTLHLQTQRPQHENPASDEQTE